MAYLGIDIGTSGCKALILSGDGEVLATHTATYPMAQPKPGWTEQEPADWIEGARRSVAGVLEIVPADEIEMIGLSGQMHGFTPLDGAGEVIRPAILWNDQRNAQEAADIVEMAGGPDGLLALTNNTMLTGYTGGKILWMQRHEPELFELVRHALNPKDYLRLILTGEYATEVSDASGTGLLDVKARKWSSALIGKLPFDQAMLPDCFESGEVSGRISSAAAKAFGLKEGTPVIGGGGDSVIQTIGSGVVSPGALQTTLGTGGILAAALESPVDNPGGRLQVFCNVDPSLWHCMGVSLNAGGSFTWLQSLFAGFDDHHVEARTMSEAAVASGPGAGGLIFLPYLNGERCPHPDPFARGGFIGLTRRHGPPDLARAVMEGVIYALYDIYQLMEQAGIGASLIQTSGGGAQSPLWRQIQADLFNCPVVTSAGAAEGGAMGAAMLAGVSAGAWSGVGEAVSCCHELTRQQPEEAGRRAYLRSYKRYARLYHDLKPWFDEMAEDEGAA